MLFSLKDKAPILGEQVFIAHNATVIGEVNLASHVSVWFNAVIRADQDKITINKGSNIQDGSVLHTDEGFPLVVGSGVTIGHKVMLHGCVIGDNSLIGINVVVLNGAKIGNNCIIGANALVTAGMIIPDGSMVMGSPARIKRQLTDKEIAALQKSADHYIDNGRLYSRDLSPIESSPCC